MTRSTFPVFFSAAVAVVAALAGCPSTSTRGEESQALFSAGEYAYGDAGALEKAVTEISAADGNESLFQLKERQEKYRGKFVAKVETLPDGKAIITFPRRSDKTDFPGLVVPSTDPRINAAWVGLPSGNGDSLIVAVLRREGDSVVAKQVGSDYWGQAAKMVDLGGGRTAVVPKYFPYNNPYPDNAYLIFRPLARDRGYAAIEAAISKAEASKTADRGGPFGVPDVSEAFDRPEKIVALFYTGVANNANWAGGHPQIWPRQFLSSMVDPGDNFTKDRIAAEFTEDWGKVHAALVKIAAENTPNGDFLVAMQGRFNDHDYNMATGILSISMEGGEPGAPTGLAYRRTIVPLAKANGMRNLLEEKLTKLGKKDEVPVSAVYPKNISLALPPDKARDFWKRTGGKVAVQLRIGMRSALCYRDTGETHYDGGGLSIVFSAKAARIVSENLMFLPSNGQVFTTAEFATPATDGAAVALKSGKILPCPRAAAQIKKYGFATYGNESFEYYVTALPADPAPAVPADDLESLVLKGPGANQLSLHKVEVDNGRYLPSEKERVTLVDARVSADGTAWRWTPGKKLDPGGSYVLWAGRSFWFFTVK